MSTQPVVEQQTPPEPPNPRKHARIIPAIKDEQGNTLAESQTFYGATEQELIDNMAKAQEHATRRIRELAKKATLEVKEYQAPEGADPFEDIPDPQPRQLTAEELAAIQAKMGKPETIREGYRELYKAETGYEPEQHAKIEAQRARDTAQVKALEAARLFMEAHPEFVPGVENKDALDQYFRTRRMPPTLRNFELAFKELSANGLLILRTEEPAPPVTTAPPIEPRIETPPAAESVIPTALTRSSASGSGQAGRSKKPTAAELAMMTADQLKKYYESTGQWPVSPRAIR